ncbi:MAG: hypothetical protein V5A33_04820 [Halobacteriales archaeon]
MAPAGGVVPLAGPLPGVDIVLLVNLVVLIVAIGLVWAWMTGRLPPGAHQSGTGTVEGAEVSPEEVPDGSATEEDAPPRDGTADAAAEWRAEAASLAREVQAVAETDDAYTDADRLARQLVPLSAELKGHARVAPPAVDSATVEQVFALGSDCYEIGMEHSPGRAARTGEFLEVRLVGLRADAAGLETSLSPG